MADPAPPRPYVSPADVPPAVLGAQERFLRALLLRRARLTIWLPEPDTWRTGPLGLVRAEEPVDPPSPARLWLLQVARPGGPGPELLPHERLTAIFGAPEQAACALALACERPDEALAASLERRLGVAVVTYDRERVAGGPRARERGATEELARSLRYPDADLATVDPADALRRAQDTIELQGFFARAARLTPRTAVTPALVALCVAIWAVGVLSGSYERYLDLGALLPLRVAEGEYWRLLTAGFLHYWGPEAGGLVMGLLHLGLNMRFLWLLGPPCERLFGNAAFLGLFLAAVAGGCVASMGWSPGGASVGASGGLFGLVGALQGYVLVRRRALPPGVFRLFTRQSLVVVGLNLALGITVSSLPGPVQVDNAGHVGGLIGGLLAGMLLARPIPPLPAPGTPEREAPPPPDPRAPLRWLGLLVLFVLLFLGAFAATRLPAFERVQARATLFAEDGPLLLRYEGLANALRALPDPDPAPPELAAAVRELARETAALAPGDAPQGPLEQARAALAAASAALEEVVAAHASGDPARIQAAHEAEVLATRTLRDRIDDLSAD